MMSEKTKSQESEQNLSADKMRQQAEQIHMLFEDIKNGIGSIIEMIDEILLEEDPE